jgi:hypothetical protein
VPLNAVAVRRDKAMPVADLDSSRRPATAKRPRDLLCEFRQPPLSDGRGLTVPQAMSASGARYANKDETFVFWNKGDTAFVTEGKDGKETYSGCATK